MKDNQENQVVFVRVAESGAAFVIARGWFVSLSVVGCPEYEEPEGDEIEGRWIGSADVALTFAPNTTNPTDLVRYSFSPLSTVVQLLCVKGGKEIETDEFGVRFATYLSSIAEDVCWQVYRGLEMGEGEITVLLPHNPHAVLCAEEIPCL